MKRFVATIFCTSLFFLGLGFVVEKTKAKFKSDEKALALIKAARQAIGGDSSIAGIQSLRIVGQTTQTMQVNGVAQTEQGETEIALMLPDKLMKTIKIGHGGDPGDSSKIVSKTMDVVIVGNDAKASMKIEDGDEPAASGSVRKVITEQGDKGEGVVTVRSADGGKTFTVRRVNGENLEWKTADPNGAPLDPNGQQMKFRVAGDGHGPMRQNELLRLTLGLLLSAPQGMDVNYTYGGESSIDGTACNVVVADFAGSSIKLFLDSSSNLPVAMSYSGMRMPKEIHFEKQTAPAADGSNQVFVFKRSGPGEEAKDDTAEFQVRFSDYRSVNGVQLPYRWTTNADGALDNTFEVTSYEANSANLADRFKNNKLMIRTKKPDGQ